MSGVAGKYLNVLMGEKSQRIGKGWRRKFTRRGNDLRISLEKLAKSFHPSSLKA